MFVHGIIIPVLFDNMFYGRILMMGKYIDELGRNTCEHEGYERHTWYERDAKGIMLGQRMCPTCADEVEADNRRRYREDVFTDSDYWQIEDD